MGPFAVLAGLESNPETEAEHACGTKTVLVIPIVFAFADVVVSLACAANHALQIDCSRWVLRCAGT